MVGDGGWPATEDGQQQWGGWLRSGGRQRKINQLDRATKDGEATSATDSQRDTTGGQRGMTGGRHGITGNWGNTNGG